MTPQGNLWQQTNQERLETRPLSADLSVDLAVIGGGFTGCAAALEAARTGASVVLLEAGTLAHGGSGRNVGLVNAGLWLPPEAVIAKLGEAAGTRLIAALGVGPATVFGLIDRHRIDCEPRPRGTLHLAHAPRGLRDLQARHRQGLRHGAPLQLLDRDETRRRTGSAAFHGALLDPRAGTLQPRAYCTGLARAATGLGAVICEDSPVTHLSHENGTWRLVARGQGVRARRVLLATNAYHANLVGGFRPAFVAVAYSQFATAPLSEDQLQAVLPGQEGCWDTAMVMSSFRRDAAGRLILGGMGDAEGPGRAIHAGWARRKLRQLYPGLGDQPFQHQWQGRIAMTGDHIPRLVEFGPGAYACFGYSGRGICPGTLMGTAAATALLTDSPEALPLPVSRDHGERFATSRARYYELGATIMHALGPHPRRAGRG
ncbi:NAD(P)/FAD-dependent oxidoreductase [Oceanicola sp. S124]|uniref:NAD(P)/FAD-dependent oxidoreductase n=1 Tax=Oceanicola sp. S124 TaxID=1042378 RepID=UPI0002557EB1|nr:FAD-binding oxidoreductase [Oceanicola sp. S124]